VSSVVHFYYQSIQLEDINTGFDRLASGHTVRQIIMM
jgi:Zn-dependent alcohol dehydrogenase